MTPKTLLSNVPLSDTIESGGCTYVYDVIDSEAGLIHHSHNQEPLRELAQTLLLGMTRARYSSVSALAHFDAMGASLCSTQPRESMTSRMNNKKKSEVLAATETTQQGIVCHAVIFIQS